MEHILGDFNVHHQLWLSSPFTDHPGELAYNFSILQDLEQLVQHPTRFPDRPGDTPNILDVFHALAGLNPRKAYGSDGVPSIVLQNCASVLAPCPVKLFQL